MRVVVCGHVTCDLIAGEQRIGGAATYAARAACELGMQTSLLTAAPENFRLLSSVRATPGLALHVVPSSDATTFELAYSHGKRQLRLLARAETLLPTHVPASFTGADVAYVAPVISECGVGLVEALNARCVAIGLQGVLRTTDAHGRVSATLPADLEAQLTGVQICVFSVEDHPDAERIAERLARAGKLVTLTRAERGASVYSSSGREEVPAAPAKEIDPTGAGDVFGVMFALGVAHRLPLREATLRAASAAARVVEGPGLGRFSRAHVPSFEGDAPQTTEE